MSEWREELDRLWELRKTREENFAIMVNCLQLLALGQGGFSSDQERLIQKIISEVLPKPITDDILRAQSSRLLDAGLNIWRGLR